MTSRKHILEPSQKEGIIQTVSSYLDSQCKEITAAYLFGSFVTAESFSDIDLGVLTAFDLEQTLDYELGLERELERMVRFSVDVRILNRAPLSFCYSIIRHRKIILDRDPNLRADFEGLIFKKYFDFAPFRKQYLAEVLNAPV